MDLELVIKNKVKLFTKVKYFKNFRNILLYQIYNCLRPHYPLSQTIPAEAKAQIKSNWSKISNLALSKITIENYPSAGQPFTDETYEINSLEYYYLYHLCHIKINHLNNLSNKEFSLIDLIQIYLQFCQEEMLNEYSIDNIKGNEFLSKTKRNSKKSKTLKNPAHNYSQKNFLNNKSHSPFNNKTKNDLLTPKILRHIDTNNKTNNNSKYNSKTIETNNENKKISENAEPNETEKNEDEYEEIGNIVLNRNNEVTVFKRKNKSTKPFLYCNSFTRLFIGETDEQSVKERYLSNIAVKNEQRLNFNGNYVDLSGWYIRSVFNKMYRGKKNKNVIVDSDVAKTFKKYEKNRQYLNNFKKRSLENDKKEIKPMLLNKQNNNSNKNLLPISDRNNYRNKRRFKNEFNKKLINNQKIKKLMLKDLGSLIGKKNNNEKKDFKINETKKNFFDMNTISFRNTYKPKTMRNHTNKCSDLTKKFIAFDNYKNNDNICVKDFLNKKDFFY